MNWIRKPHQVVFMRCTLLLCIQLCITACGSSTSLGERAGEKASPAMVTDDHHRQKMFYRIITTCTEYHVNGAVTYLYQTSAIREVTLKDNGLTLNWHKGLSAQVGFTADGDNAQYLFEGLITHARPNTWIRLKKATQDTFGHNVDCELWYGRQKPNGRISSRSAEWSIAWM